MKTKSVFPNLDPFYKFLNQSLWEQRGEQTLLTTKSIKFKVPIQLNNFLLSQTENLCFSVNIFRKKLTDKNNRRISILTI